MRMIICGMGEVGRHIAAELAETGHDVVAVDSNHAALQEVEATLDVLTLRGHAALPTTLDKAGADKAQLVAAVTNHDETNLVVALAARQAGAHVTVARLSNRDYFPDTSGWLEGRLGVDLTLCPGLLAGGEVVRLARATTVDWVENFAGHLVQVMAITLDEGVPAAGRAASQLNLGEHCRMLGVVRDGATQAPESIPHLQPEDQVILAGPAASLYRVDETFRGDSRKRGRAVVVGGGPLGANVATELLKIMDSVALVERDPERAEALAERLNGVDIYRGDGTSIPFLQELDVQHARAFVATTSSDEVNLMGTLLSKQLGVEQAIALLHRPDYTDVYEALGIDSTVSPRLLVSREIVRYLRRRQGALEVRIPIDGSVIFEVQLDASSPLAGKRLFDLDLPHGVQTVAVTRRRELRAQPEQVILEAGDTVVVFAPERTAAAARRELLAR